MADEHNPQANGEMDGEDAPPSASNGADQSADIYRMRAMLDRYGTEVVTSVGPVGTIGPPYHAVSVPSSV